jgi:hypothetical protein
MAVLGSALSTAAEAILAGEQAGRGERSPLLKSHLRLVEMRAATHRRSTTSSPLCTADPGMTTTPDASLSPSNAAVSPSATWRGG